MTFQWKFLSVKRQTLEDKDCRTFSHLIIWEMICKLNEIKP